MRPEQQGNPLAAGLFPHMVQVCVDKEELPAVAASPQDYPRGQAFAGAVPAFRAGPLGLLAEPEGPRIEQFEGVGTEEDGIELPGAVAVLAAYTDRAVIGQQGSEVIVLVGQQLLRAEDIGCLLTEHRGDAFAAEPPVVLPVLGVVVAHVHRHDDKLLRLGLPLPARCGGKEGKTEKPSFHRCIL